MEPTVRRLAAAGCPVRRINIDQDRPLAARFHVEKIPCFVMLVDGREVDRVVGLTSLSRLEQMCEVGRTARPSVLIAPVLVTPSGPSTPPVRLAGHVTAPGDTPRSWAPVSPTPPPVPPAADAAMLAASVRLRIEDANGHACGTGTIIGSRPGEALVLTCGHIFRDSEGKGRIEVDLFGPHPANRVSGQLVGYDLKRDVGLVLIRPPVPVTPARVAPPGYTIRPEQLVASVGCNNGDAPTVQWSQVVALDRFLGPPNIEVSGQPIVGRSGGGLFSAEGLVIGVCNAADPGQREGLFAALRSIQAQLDQLGLAGLYAPPQPAAPGGYPAAGLAGLTRPPAGEAPRAFSGSGGEPASAGSPTPRVRLPVPADPAAALANDRGRLSASQQAALDEVRRGIIEGDEVAIIIRDHRNPEAKGRVITIDGATPARADQSLAGTGPANALYNTSLEVPRPRTPILEWDLETGWRHREAIPPRAP
jgi:hypothetical protein